MTRKRNLMIMAGILVLLCCVIGIEKMVTRHTDSINSTDEVILEVDQDTVTDISWTYDGDSLAFEKTDGSWYDSDDGDFPVNQDTMTDFLACFEEVHATFIIEDVDDYSQYGLEDPQCTVTINTDDEEIVVSLGDYSTMDEQRYIEIGDGKVYMIEEDILESVTTDRDDFMQQDETPSVATLEKMTVTGGASLNAVYDADGSYSYTDSYNYYNVDGKEYLSLDDTLVESYLSTLDSVELTDYVTYTASDDDIEEYGLDDPAYTITIKGATEEDSDGEAWDIDFVLYIATVDEGSDSDDETVYARVGDSSIIYQLSSDDYESLTACDYDDLRPTEVFSIEWSDVTSLSFEIDGSTYDVDTMTWKEYKKTLKDDDDEEEADIVYLIDDQRVDFDTVTEAIEALTINSFDDGGDTDTLEMSVTINVDNDDYPSVTAEIYRYDGDDCLVVVDGETVGLMSRSSMADLKEAVTSVTLGLE